MRDDDSVPCPAQAQRAVRRWGATAFAFDVLQNPEQYNLFASRVVPDALVAYRIVGRTDVVVGEPLAPPERMAEVVAEFVAERRAAGRRILGFLASQTFARAIVAQGGGAAQLTAEPEIDPATYEPRGGSAKKLRAYVRRLRRAGLDACELPRMRVPPPELQQSVEALTREWIVRGTARRAHFLEVDAWKRLEEKRLFAVFDPKDGERLLALLIAHPVYAENGWHLCHLIRSPDAPKGVNELAVMGAIERLADEGVRYATFGPFAVPCAGEFLGFSWIMERLIRTAYRLAATTGGYARSVEFYRKVQSGPWQPRYIAFAPRSAALGPFLIAARLTHALGLLRRD